MPFSGAISETSPDRFELKLLQRSSVACLSVLLLAAHQTKVGYGMSMKSPHLRPAILASLALALSVPGCGGGSGSNSGQTDPVAPPPTNSVSGTVTFADAPVQGATVIAFDTNSNSVAQSATTDGNGNYQITGLMVGGENYQILVQSPGYAFYPNVASGAQIMRADYTAQYTSSNLNNGSPYNGVFFAVISFNSELNSPLTGVSFNAYNGSNPLVYLAATGQTHSYAAGDDGANQEGVVWPIPRFVNNGDGTVTDKLTGLIWLMNANCLGAANWATAVALANALASGNGACGLSDNSTAGQWRLPNINELESLIDAGNANPALPTGYPFTGINTSGHYWSSTTFDGNTANAWAISFSDGSYVNDGVANAKANASNQVWAVKGVSSGVGSLQATGQLIVYATGDDASVNAGVPITSPRFIDNGNGTVTDSMTGLIWLKQANCIQGTWSAVLTAIANLAAGQCGLSDGTIAGNWRMPNRHELLSLSDRALSNHAEFFDSNYVATTSGLSSQPATFGGTFEVSQYYWTSTTDAAETTQVWSVLSSDFGVYPTGSSASQYSLAVR